MSFRDLLVIGEDGKITTNRAYYGPTSFDPLPEKKDEKEKDKGEPTNG
jgi:hypothetical protein